VIPSVRKSSGWSQASHPLRVKLGHAIPLDTRPEFYRVSLLFEGTSNHWVAYGTGSQASSRVLSMASADALLQLPPKTLEKSRIEIGELVDAILL
jgi:gephyrin